ncbi:MAG: CHAT domain-containing tetratricopeptide repeat protein [Bacteroidota bacterium]|nr:CHAT domain-containing tetratricopeptide repeat protein [Bacteroidota bacterium]
MKKGLFILILGLSVFTIQAQILNKLKKIVEEEEVVRVLKDELINHLENSKKEYEAIDYNYAVSFSDNSGLYENEERYMRYQKILLEVLKGKSFSEKSAREQAKNFNDAGEMLYAGNRFRSAELAFAAALAIYEDNGLATTKDAALTISNLGLVYHSTGRYSKAEEYTLKALEIRKIYLKDNIGYGASLNNLAVLYKDMGKFNESEELFKKAHTWIKKANSENSNPYAIVLNNEAMLFQTIGRYEQAESLLNKAIDIADNNLKKKSPNYIRLYVNLALLYQLMGELDKAENIYLQTLAIQEKRLGHKHPDYASLLRNLAALYQQKGNLDKVEGYLMQARDIYKRKFGAKNALYAKATYELAAYYQYINVLEKAEQLLFESKEIQEQILNEHHPDYTITLDNFAVLYWQKKDIENAAKFYKRVMDEYLYQINNYFPPMSEKEKAAFWAKVHPKILRFYAFVTDVIQQKPELATDMYNYHIRTKGLLLSSTNKIKHQILNSENKRLINNYNDWVDSKKYLARLYTLSEDELKKEKVNVDSVERATNTKEKELSKLSAEFAEGLTSQSISCNEITDMLDEQEGTVEIIRIPAYHYLKPDTSVFYGALVLTKNQSVPLLVILKNGKELEEKYVREYQRNMQKASKSNTFFHTFWEPIGKKTTNKSKLYVSLDGVYNQINLNTLQDVEGNFLIDKTNIVYVSNTKELEKIKIHSASQQTFANKQAILFGNPNYAQNLDWNKVTEMPLPELPGTKEEVEKINQILKHKNWSTKTYFSDEASEQNIKSVNQPPVLHIATHGFFLPDVKKTDQKIFGVDPEKAKENPLLRSGLMFAGADNTIQQIGNPENQSSDDGILNAYEAMLLNLSNTELIILSACETGLGEVVNGEGVYGLQRAFQIAGSKTIIMSLWQVSDEVTQKLMAKFYGYLLESNDKIYAFNKAQMEIKEDYPAPFYWGAFILMNN